jgi:hypothetical protein
MIPNFRPCVPRHLASGCCSSTQTCLWVSEKVCCFSLLLPNPLAFGQIPQFSAGIENAFGIGRCASLAELLAQCDCLSLHCPLTAETRHIINSVGSRPFLCAI